jgi:hypothetical protein
VYELASDRQVFPAAVSRYQHSLQMKGQSGLSFRAGFRTAVFEPACKEIQLSTSRYVKMRKDTRRIYATYFRTTLNLTAASGSSR